MDSLKLSKVSITIASDIRADDGIRYQGSRE